MRMRLQTIAPKQFCTLPLTHEQLLEVAPVIAENKETPTHLPILVESNVVGCDWRTHTGQTDGDNADHIRQGRVLQPLRLVAQHHPHKQIRSEERRVGKECVSTCRS